jgi:hypothetical protein
MRFVLGVAALVAGAVLSVASPAAAADTIGDVSDIGTVDDSVGADSSTLVTLEDAGTVAAAASSFPTDCTSISVSGWGIGCFHRNGDLIYVKDTSGNGQAAYVYWENYLRTSSGTWKLRRYGTCTNYSVGVVGSCDYNFYEDTTLNAFGGHGSGVRVWICQKGSGCTSNYVWVRNNA